MRSWWPADAGSAANEWLGSVRCKPTTAETYRLVIGKHMPPALGKRPAFAVGHKEAMELHHALSAQPMTANRAVEFLSRIFNADENRGQIPERSYPCLPAGGQGPRARKRERFLTDEESARDPWWGARPVADRYEGRNVLGRLWMELRQQLLEGNPESRSGAWLGRIRVGRLAGGPVVPRAAPAAG